MINDRTFKQKHQGEFTASWNEHTDLETIKRAKNVAKHRALQMMFEYIDTDKTYEMRINTDTHVDTYFDGQNTRYKVIVTLWEL